MHVSARLRQVVTGGDDGWGVHYRARAMKAAGRAVTLLTVGDHDTATPEPFADALVASLRAGNTGYPPVIGTRALREAVAARVARNTAAPCTADEVVVTPGGQAALYAAMMAAFDPGEACVVIDPYYATFGQTVRAASGTPIAVAARADDGFQPDAAAIEAALTPATRAVLINSPNNPTGAVYSRATLEAIAELARRRGLWVISDEVYEGQVHDGPHLSIRSLPGMAARTLVVGSMSKSHGMTGWRLGWVAGPAEAAARIGDLAITTTYGVAGFIQDAALAALQGGAAEEAEIAARYRRRRDLAFACLANRPGLRLHPAAGGMYAMIDIRPTGLSGSAFAEQLLDAEGIAVMPGESFGEAAAGHARIALTRPDDELAEALARIARFAGARAAERAA